METIKTFEIGFAPNDFDILEKVLVKKKRATAKELEDVGLVFIKNGHATDRFRGRIMFPLYNHRGDLQGFAGRILPEFDTKNVGKYINSPETILYHKGSNLFGLWFTRKDIKQKGFAVLVEGPLDAIAAYQSGTKNVAAIQGTSLTENQVKLLSRFTKKIVFSLDSDFAGDAAERKGINIAESEGLEVRVARLTKYKDPGDAAILDPKGYESVIQNAVGVWDFIIDSIFGKFEVIDGGNKAKISRELIPLLATIEDSIVRTHYASIAAQRLGVPAEVVIEEMSKKGSPRYKEEIGRLERPKVVGRKEILGERLLSLSFSQNHEYLLLHENILSRISDPTHTKILTSFLSYAKNNSSLDITLFSKTLDENLQKVFQELMLKNWDDMDKNEAKDYNAELDRINRELELLFVRSDLDTIALEVKSLKGRERKKKLFLASKKYKLLQKLQSQLEDK